MKVFNLKITTLLATICLLFSNYELSATVAPASTDGTVTFSVLTVSNGATYSPKNVLAIWVKDAQGTLAGTVHSNEYVIPEWMRSLPEVVYFERILEGIRTGGKSSSTTASPSAPSVNAVATLQASPDNSVKDSLDRLNEILNDGITTKFSLLEFKKILAKLDKIEADSSL